VALKIFSDQLFIAERAGDRSFRTIPLRVFLHINVMEVILVTREREAKGEEGNVTLPQVYTMQIVLGSLRMPPADPDTNFEGAQVIASVTGFHILSIEDTQQ